MGMQEAREPLLATLQQYSRAFVQAELDLAFLALHQRLADALLAYLKDQGYRKKVEPWVHFPDLVDLVRKHTKLFRRDRKVVPLLISLNTTRDHMLRPGERRPSAQQIADDAEQLARLVCRFWRAWFGEECPVSVTRPSIMSTRRPVTRPARSRKAAHRDESPARQPVARPSSPRETARVEASVCVFVSYSRRDKDYARRLESDLRGHGFEVWIDDRIDFGKRWWQTVVQAIRDSGAFIVVMTPDSEASEWVEREVQFALREGKPIFPLLLQGREFPLLITTQYVDVTDDQLPPLGFYERLGQLVPTRSVPKPTAPTPEPKGQSG